MKVEIFGGVFEFDTEKRHSPPHLKSLSWENGFAEHIKNCVQKNKDGYSKLNNRAMKMDGMIGPQARNLLNLLCEVENCNYLQIGTWKGACLYSALYKNNVNYAFACDDFSQYSQSQVVTDTNEKINLNFDTMLNLIQPQDSGEKIQFEFYDGNCWSLPLNKIKKPINLYFYDGGHKTGDHFLSLYYFYPVLAENFIFICDDWSEQKVRDGTYAAINQCNYGIVYETVEHNLYIANLAKDKMFGQRLAFDRQRKSPILCTLDNTAINKEKK